MANTKLLLIADMDQGSGIFLSFFSGSKMTKPSKTPLQVVQAQLDAYNAKDIDALLLAYAPDAEQYTLHGELLARGQEQMRQRFLARFAEPDLQARLINRTSMANVVVDYELVTRNFPEGVGTVEMICVYEVANERIQKASFAVGETRLNARP